MSTARFLCVVALVSMAAAKIQAIHGKDVTEKDCDSDAHGKWENDQCGCTKGFLPYSYGR
jgi:hypothetical protein